MARGDDASSVFIKVCVGVITAATIGIFIRVSELTANVAVLQSQQLNMQSSAVELKSIVNQLTAENAATKIELVRLRGQCETWWNAVSKRIGLPRP